MSETTEDTWKKMQKIVEDFMARNDCEPFREPVPWKEMGLTDYPLLIKNPMDLGTVLQRLKSRKYYKNVYQAADDVRLVWSNCMMYNADGSDFFKLADTLQRRFDDKYSKLLQDVGVVNTAEAGKVSLQDKRNMAKLMYQVSKEDLGRILVEVEQKCPAAIKRNATEDELELNVDAITGPVLKELTAQLQEMAKEEKGRTTEAEAPAVVSKTEDVPSSKPKKARTSG